MVPVVKARRRALALSASVIAACGALAGCTGTGMREKGSTAADVKLPDPGKAASTKTVQNLTVGFSQPISTMDPTSGNSGYFLLGGLSMEQLLQVGPDGKLRPWLATSWSQPSPTQYRYDLRHGVTFWDGSELTSDDVVYSLLRDAGASLGKSGFYASVKSVTAEDRYTVVVSLTKPDATWTNIPALFYAQIYQKAFVEAHKKTFGQPGTLIMGTGPWRMDSLDPTKEAVFTANPTYWGGEPSIKKITVKLYASDNSMALAVRAGDVDLVPIVAQPDSFRSSSGAQVTTASTCGTSLFTMNTKVTPWSDVHVRKAVAYAFDKSTVLKATGGSAISTLDYLIAPRLLQSLTNRADADKALATVTTYPHDLVKAKAELAQSTVPSGFTAEITSTNDQSSLRISQALAAQLKPLGISLKIKSVSLTEQIPLIIGPEGKRPTGFLSTGACAPDPSWDDIFLGTGGLNEAGWHPADVDQLLATGRSEQDPSKRLATYTKVLQRVNEEVPYVPLFLEGTSYASNKYDWVGYGSFWQSTSWGLDIKPRES